MATVAFAVDRWDQPGHRFKVSLNFSVSKSKGCIKGPLPMETLSNVGFLMTEKCI